MALPAFAQTGGSAVLGAKLGCHYGGLCNCHRSGTGGTSQGKVGAAACEGMARNPAARSFIQLALILGLAFIESLVLFTLVIIFVKVA